MSREIVLGTMCTYPGIFVTLQYLTTNHQVSETESGLKIEKNKKIKSKKVPKRNAVLLI